MKVIKILEKELIKQDDKIKSLKKEIFNLKKSYDILLKQKEPKVIDINQTIIAENERLKKEITSLKENIQQIRKRNSQD